MTLLAVAWDIDGTLVDSEPLHHRALVAASLDHGVDLTDLPDQAFRGIHMGDVWTALRPRLPQTLDQGRWLSDIEAYYAKHRAELVAVPGAAETIRRLSMMGIRQVCVSNSGRMIVDANLDSLASSTASSFRSASMMSQLESPIHCHMPRPAAGLAWPVTRRSLSRIAAPAFGQPGQRASSSRVTRRNSGPAMTSITPSAAWAIS